jgi:hypothetical protein
VSDWREVAERNALVTAIADKEAKLAERFSPVVARSLAEQLVSLRSIARTAAQRREADEAISDYNENAREFGVEEI